MTEHEVVESEEERCYPQRDLRAPDYFHFYCSLRTSSF